MRYDSFKFLLREWWTSVDDYLEGDEDDEVGQVEAEHLGAGGGAGHHLQGGGEQRSLLGGGQAWQYITQLLYFAIWIDLATLALIVSPKVHRKC